jgi:hypothetical protein
MVIETTPEHICSAPNAEALAVQLAEAPEQPLFRV